MSAAQFCGECAGPFLAAESESYRWLEEGYGGHWDTCPNRVRPDRTHGGIYTDVERVDAVIAQMPSIGFGAYYVDAVRAARDALAIDSRPRGRNQP